MKRFLLACGLAAPLLFAIVFLVAGATRAQYDALLHPISSLSLGPSGWVQRANFFVTGALMFAFAYGVHGSRTDFHFPKALPILLALCATGLAGAASFLPDPFNGYPPGTPVTPLTRTPRGIIHDVSSALFFIPLPIACFVLGYRRFRAGRSKLAVYSLGSGAGFVVMLALASAGFAQVQRFAPLAGLFHRAAVIIGFAWIATLSWHMLRS